MEKNTVIMNLKSYTNMVLDNHKMQEELKELKEEIKGLKEQEKMETPLKKLEDKMLANAVVTDEHRYGAQIIGKIVVSAAKRCNQLTAAPPNSNDVKELVNLILGRTEIAKAEILNIVESNSEFLNKQSLIDAQLNQCEDYFDSIMAQN